MFTFLTSDYPLLLTIILISAFIIRPNRSVVRWMWNDPTPWARAASRLSFGAVAVFLLWTTVLDNWRQMLGYLVDEHNRWKSDQYLSDPPPDSVRFFTFVLFGLSVLAGCYLYARYARGYFIPILAGPLGFVTFYILNGFRMRFETIGPLSEGADYTSPLEAASMLFWFGVLYCAMFVLFAAVYAFFWGPAAIIFSLVFRRTIGKEHVEEPAMYRVLRERRMARESHEPPR
jgi:hypothetical protein